MDLIETLEKLIRIDTCNPERTVVTRDRGEVGIGNGRYEIHDYLEGRLEAAGFEVRRQYLENEEEDWQAELEDGSSETIPRRYNLVAEKGAGERSLLLFGHLDTVPVKAGWGGRAHEPWTGKLDVEGRGEREVLYGLGSNDMKAGLAVMLDAAEAFVADGYKLKLAYLEDEEFWSFGVHRLLEDEEFLADVAAALVPEIGDTEEEHHGARQIMFGRMGRTEFELRVPGRSTHGAFVRQGKGHSALDDLGLLMRRLSEYCGEESAKELTYAGGRRRIRNAAYLNHVHGGARTLSVPEAAVVYLDRSFLPLTAGETVEAELQRLRDVVDGLYEDNVIEPVVMDDGTELRITVEPASRPTPRPLPYCLERQERDPFVRFLAGRVQAAFDAPAEYAIGHSVADENVLGNWRGPRGEESETPRFPVVVIGPTGRRSHQANEWVSLDSVREVARLYRDVVDSFGQFLDPGA